jgi:arginase
MWPCPQANRQPLKYRRRLVAQLKRMALERIACADEMRDSKRSVQIIEVQHASAVAAIATAEGPRAIIEAGLLDSLASAGATADLSHVPDSLQGSGAVGDAFAVARQVALAVQDAFERQRTPIVLSGSCHTALGSVAGLPSGRRGVIWLDCHGDFNTPDTTESGLLDGTVLATITGRCWKRLAQSVPGFEPVSDMDVFLVGARDLDPGEERLLAAAEISRLSSEDVQGGNLGVLRMLATQVESVYVHIDLDVLDRTVGRANAFARSGGLSPSDLEEFLGVVSASFGAMAVGMTSYDPRWDQDGSIARAAIRAATAIVR